MTDIKKIRKQKEVDRMFLDIAKRISLQSKCVSHQVGSVLTKDDRIITTGFNGTPSGFLNCNDKFDPKNFVRADHRAWSAKFEIHSEMNTILFAAKHGIETEGTTMYCTLQPCHNCLKHMIQAGVTRVVYENTYDRNDYTEETEMMIESSDLEFEKFED